MAAVLEHLGRRIAVGHIARGQAGRTGLAKDRHRPFARDQRLVVRADDAGRPLRERDGDDLPWRDLAELEHRTRIAQGLRADPVLAVAAMQVAAQHAEAQSARPGQRMVERLFLDRIAMQRVDVSVGDA